jgi:hypothetical protein
VKKEKDKENEITGNKPEKPSAAEPEKLPSVADLKQEKEKAKVSAMKHELKVAKA